MNDDEMRELLRNKADEMRLGRSIPERVLRRSKRRRAMNAVMASTLAVGLGVGAFVGVRSALNGGTAPPAHRFGGTGTTTQRAELWFTYHGSLFVSPTKIVISSGASPQDMAVAALHLLTTGPGSTDSGAGVSTALPAGTSVEAMSVSDGVAHVDLSTHVESDPLSDAQVVYTLTQFPGIDRVSINDQEGGPLGRDDLAAQLPPILLEQPFAGQTISSPVTVSGTADVFEAVVSIRIVAGEGTVVADTTTMASCGSGCRGDWSKAVSFSVPQEETGTVVVYEASAKDGSPTNEVRIPVTLEPGGTAPSETGFDGIWPVDDEAQLQAFQTDLGPDHAYALQPDTTATTFAAQIAHWNPNAIGVHAVQTQGDQSYVELWNTVASPTWSKDISLNVQLRKAGRIWVVRHADDGVFDLLDPSTRQDGIVGTSQPISGQFAQAPAGWTVTAVLIPAGSDLQNSPAMEAANPTISGDRFDGTVPVPNTAGGDLELVVSVTDRNGETLGMWARRFVTAG